MHNTPKITHTQPAHAPLQKRPQRQGHPGCARWRNGRTRCRRPGKAPAATAGSRPPEDAVRVERGVAMYAMVWMDGLVAAG
eukprot:scaffold100731_cov19-Tisochrysis_lutea.AAC.1